MFPEPDPSTSRGTRCAWPNKFNARTLQGCNELHEGIHVATDHAFARLHPLDGRNREVRKFGRLALIDIEKSPCGPKLIRCDHRWRSILLELRANLYDLNRCLKHQTSCATYHGLQFRCVGERD
jgi:hypothetical protein